MSDFEDEVESTDQTHGNGLDFPGAQADGAVATPSSKRKKANPPFLVTTMNVKDFCTILTGLGNIPNIEHILLQFSPKGMMLYGKPRESPVVAVSFWNQALFQDYVCSSVVEKWVSKDRLENLRKKICKDVELLSIKVLEHQVSGFTFSGQRSYKIGGECQFSFHVFGHKCDLEPVEMNQLASRLGWHISTPSDKFKDNVDFMDDKSEFVSLQIENKQLVLVGVADTGLENERIFHTVEGSDSNIKFSSLFYKKFLKVITSTQSLHKSVTISFNPDESEYVYPVLFSYTIDHEEEQSHFSVYLLPFAEPS